MGVSFSLYLSENVNYLSLLNVNSGISGISLGLGFPRCYNLDLYLGFPRSFFTKVTEDDEPPRARHNRLL